MIFLEPIYELFPMYVSVRDTSLWRNQEKGMEPKSHVILFAKFGKRLVGGVGVRYEHRRVTWDQAQFEGRG